MTKPARLLEIIRILHKRKYAVTAQELALAFGVSVRTVYRDILTLQQQGIPVDGESGVGYILRKGYTLPPLMFSADEIEALVIGAKWVLSTGDSTLSTSAKEAIRKIKDIIPPVLVYAMDETPLVIGQRNTPHISKGLTEAIHESIKKRLKLRIKYSTKDTSENERIIWPIALGYFNDTIIIAAWCELREAFRHFRIDRITKWTLYHEKYPSINNELYHKWLEDQNITNSDFDT